MEPPQALPLPTPEEIHSFLAAHVGPASARSASAPDGVARVHVRMRGGMGRDDAVLAVVHAAAREDREVAEEFLACFLPALGALGRGAVARGMRRLLETGDLVQSVAGDLWPQLMEVEFRGRAAFLALLAARLRWKAADRARDGRAAKRREDLRQDGDPGRLVGDEGPSPATLLGDAEEQRRALLALARLPERDRRLVRGRFEGMGWAELAAQEGVEPESARKAVQRALARIRLQLGAEGQG